MLAQTSRQALMAVSGPCLHTLADHVFMTNYPSVTASLASKMDEALRVTRTKLGLHPSACASHETRPDSSFTEDRINLPARNGGAALITAESRQEACFLGALYRTMQLMVDRKSPGGTVIRGSCSGLSALLGDGAFDSGGLGFSELVAGSSVLGQEVKRAFEALESRSEQIRAKIHSGGLLLFGSQAKLDDELAGMLAADPTNVGFAEIGCYPDGAPVDKGKLTKAIMRSYFDAKETLLRVRARKLPPDDPRRRAFGQATTDSARFFLDSLHPHIAFSGNEFVEAVNFQFGLPTEAASDARKHSTYFSDRVMDKYGWGLNNLISLKDGGQRTKLHNTINGFLEKAALSTQADYTCEIDDLLAAKLPPGSVAEGITKDYATRRSQRNVIPDVQLNMEEGETFGKISGGVELNMDTKTVSSEAAYNGASNLFESVVAQREKKVHPGYLRHGAEMDEALYPGLEVAPNRGPIVQFLCQLAHPVQGIVVGAFGEFSPNTSSLLKYIADRLEFQFACQAGASTRGKKGHFLWDLKRRLSLTAIRGWARLRLKRAGKVAGLCDRLVSDVPQYDPMGPGAPADGLHDAFVAEQSHSAFW